MDRLGRRPSLPGAVRQLGERSPAEPFVVLAIFVTGIGIFGNVANATIIGSILLLLLGVTLGLTRLAVRDIALYGNFSSQRVPIGRTTTLQFTFINKKPLPLGWLKVSITLPQGLATIVEASDGTSVRRQTVFSNEFWIGADEEVGFERTIVGEERGRFLLDEARITIGDPLGVFRHTHTLRISSTDATAEGSARLIVHTLTVSESVLRNRLARDLLGSQARALPYGKRALDPARIREYQAGDPLRSIDWKTTARSRVLQVREPEREHQSRWLILTECATDSVVWRNHPILFEAVAVATASVARALWPFADQLWLHSNGWRGKPDDNGSNLTQPIVELQHAMDLVSRLQPMPSLAPETGLSRAVIRHGVHGLVWITAEPRPSTMRELVGIAHRVCKVYTYHVTTDATTRQEPGRIIPPALRPAASCSYFYELAQRSRRIRFEPLEMGDGRLAAPALGA